MSENKESKKVLMIGSKHLKTSTFINGTPDVIIDDNEHTEMNDIKTTIDRSKVTIPIVNYKSFNDNIYTNTQFNSPSKHKNKKYIIIDKRKKRKRRTTKKSRRNNRKK